MTKVLNVSVGGVHCTADQEFVKRAFRARIQGATIDFRMRNSPMDPKLVVVSGIDEAALDQHRHNIAQALTNGICQRPTVVHESHPDVVHATAKAVKTATPARMPLG
jgi:hypothetical protein